MLFPLRNIPNFRNFIPFRINRLYGSSSSIHGNRRKVKRHYMIPEEIIQARNENANVHRYISAYRKYGHLKADINPLLNNTHTIYELDPHLYGLDNNQYFNVNGLLANHNNENNLLELQKHLDNLYCGKLSVEFCHLPTVEEREWFLSAFENLSNTHGTLSEAERKNIARTLLISQAFDKFLTVKFQSVKRYSGEGAESNIIFCDELFRQLTKGGVQEAVLGMAHRGRLNILTGLLEVPASILFRKMMGLSEFPADIDVPGDVLTHIVSSVDLKYSGKNIHVTMFPNPSHLEAINPVVIGKTRARQRTLIDGSYSTDEKVLPGEKVVCVQIHGDASISGQGVLQEGLNLSCVPHYNIGGSVHLCTNNQVGYTAEGQNTRSSLYPTDIAKLCSFPIIHVNGNDPEAVIRATRLAVEYQRKFRRDVFVDLVCWRRWGHNELDNPRFTNPKMYSVIDSMKNVPEMYVDQLVYEGIMKDEEAKDILSEEAQRLNDELRTADTFTPKQTFFQRQWAGFSRAPEQIEIWDTGVNTSTLQYLGAKSVQTPDNFTVHPHLQKTHVEARLKKLQSGEGIDWATGEALAMASLLDQGFHVRISGQDVGRGTFSQRHCILIDQKTEDQYVPLNDIKDDQYAYLEPANSILSEEAVLGFEYGFSVESPNTLCIWEAQFGDFFNGAQIIIDTFVTSGEDKWMMQSGLVMLLPHGFDGAGAEHSSCHLERFLQNCDSKESSPDSENVNWNVVFPTTSAQIFHLLRKQMIRNYRKPLIVAGPKAILRLSAASSSLNEMAPGTHFLPVIGDNSVNRENVKKVIFVCGKHFYALDDQRKKRGITDTAIIRLEQLCPFPTHDVNEQLDKYKKAKTVIWSQEEHQNMGAWFFVQPRFRNMCRTQMIYVGRAVSAPVATGIDNIHKAEEQKIFEECFKN